MILRDGCDDNLGFQIQYSEMLTEVDDNICGRNVDAKTVKMESFEYWCYKTPINWTHNVTTNKVLRRIKIVELANIPKTRTNYLAKISLIKNKRDRSVATAI